MFKHNKRNKLSKKSTFEEAIEHYLDGDLRDSALEFAAWAKTNGFAPRQWNNPDCWKIPQGEAHLVSYPGQGAGIRERAAGVLLPRRRRGGSPKGAAGTAGRGGIAKGPQALPFRGGLRAGFCIY